MPLRVAASLAFLFLFSASAVAQIFAPSCTSASWQWTFNSLGQSPCDVAAYMMSTCNLGKYELDPLPPGYVYSGPGRPDHSDTADLCLCSTVGYSLFSACGACQGGEWMNWSRWIANCTKTLPPGSYPNPIPSGTRLPHWALLDVTSENYWNSSKSQADSNSPEIPPGTILSPSSVSNSITPTSSSNASSTTSPAPPPPGSRSSNTSAIVGGVVGCMVAILIAIVAIFYIRQRPRERSALSTGTGAFQPRRPLSDRGTFAPSSLPMSPVAMKFFGTNDSTAFQGNHVGPQSLGISSPIGSESTLDHGQLSQSQYRVYHGHPAV